MLAAEAAFREGREAVIRRATTVIDTGTGDEAVGRYRRRRLLRRRRPVEVDLPATRLDAIRRVAGFVEANAVLLDAAEADDPDRLDPAADAIELELRTVDAATAVARFETHSIRVLDRCLADPELGVSNVYPVARTASDLAAFVAVELHLAARMLDPTHAPTDARALARLVNQALRPVLGSGLENWITERVTPWRNLVIRRGLAWP
ncbi:MAG: hypothetical protein AAGA90_11300 [Actinomycetota bacterium]